MKQWIVVLTMCALTTLAKEELRTFTAQDGRTLKARVLSYDATTDKVQIERADKKKMTVPSTAFSKKDPSYIKKWHATDVFQSTSKFKVKLEREEVKSTKKEHNVDIGEDFGGGRRGGESGVITVAIDKNTQYRFRVLMENSSDTALNNITLEYRIFYEQQKAVLDEKANKGRREDDPRPERYRAVDQDKIKDGAVRVKPIESRSSKELTTGNVVLLRRSASRPWGDKIDLKSSLSGAWIQLTMKGPDGEKIVRSLATSTSIPKKYSWELPETDLNDELTDSGNTEQHAADR